METTVQTTSAHDVIAVALLALATFVITAVIVRVGVATARGQLLVPEG